MARYLTHHAGYLIPIPIPVIEEPDEYAAAMTRSDWLRSPKPTPFGAEGFGLEPNTVYERFQNLECKRSGGPGAPDTEELVFGVFDVGGFTSTASLFSDASGGSARGATCQAQSSSQAKRDAGGPSPFGGIGAAVQGSPNRVCSPLSSDTTSEFLRGHCGLASSRSPLTPPGSGVTTRSLLLNAQAAQGTAFGLLSSILAGSRNNPAGPRARPGVADRGAEGAGPEPLILEREAAAPLEDEAGAPSVAVQVEGAAAAAHLQHARASAAAEAQMARPGAQRGAEAAPSPAPPPQSAADDCEELSACSPFGAAPPERPLFAAHSGVRAHRDDSNGSDSSAADAVKLVTVPPHYLPVQLQLCLRYTYGPDATPSFIVQEAPPPYVPLQMLLGMSQSERLQWRQQVERAWYAQICTLPPLRRSAIRPPATALEHNATRNRSSNNGTETGGGSINGDSSGRGSGADALQAHASKAYAPKVDGDGELARSVEADGSSGGGDGCRSGGNVVDGDGASADGLGAHASGEEGVDEGRAGRGDEADGSVTPAGGVADRRSKTNANTAPATASLAAASNGARGHTTTQAWGWEESSGYPSPQIRGGGGRAPMPYYGGGMSYYGGGSVSMPPMYAAPQYGRFPLYGMGSTSMVPGMAAPCMFPDGRLFVAVMQPVAPAFVHGVPPNGVGFDGQWFNHQGSRWGHY